jgi:hypothetical protein
MLIINFFQPGFREISVMTKRGLDFVVIRLILDYEAEIEYLPSLLD